MQCEPLSPAADALWHELIRKYPIARGEAPGGAPTNPECGVEDGVPAPAPPEPLVIDVFDLADVDRMAGTARNARSEGQAAIERQLARMKRQGSARQLVMALDRAPLVRLREDFPNFDRVLDAVEGCLALAMRDERPVLALQPMLLLGDPGVGKTTFASALAQALGTTFRVLPLNSTSAGWVLGGLDASWASAKPGLVFEELVNGSLANPLLLLDELDKAQVAARGHNPVGALYTLLESETARRFADEFVPVPLDASRIIWLATANDARLVDPVILSRLEVFQVDPPTPAQSAAVARSVYRRLREDVPGGKSFPEALPGDVEEALAEVPPRRMRRALHVAMRAAALRGFNDVSAADIELPRKRRPMGFAP